MARKRSLTLRAMRRFLDDRGFLEVETPVLQPLYGGASATPFTTEYRAYDQQVFLRISDELYLKRLVVGGLDRVYEIGHNFRNEGDLAQAQPRVHHDGVLPGLRGLQRHDGPHPGDAAVRRDGGDGERPGRLPGRGRSTSVESGRGSRCTMRSASVAGSTITEHGRPGVAPAGDPRGGPRAQRRPHLGAARGRPVQRLRRAGAPPAHLHHELPGGALAPGQALDGRSRASSSASRCSRSASSSATPSAS